MPPAPIPVAIVEDEAILREELSFQLSHLGCTVEAFANAQQLYRRLAVHSFSVVVLDIGLEGEDGLAICTYLRQHDKRLGIIFVTARAQRDDRLNGLHAGADAYLTKPVDIDELALLIKRLAERAVQAAAADGPDLPAAVTTSISAPPGGWQLDLNNDFLSSPAGQRIRITLNEARILGVLLDQPGQVVCAAQLAQALGLLPDEYDKHRLEVIISRLRDKVWRETGGHLPIQAKRGSGYLFMS